MKQELRTTTDFHWLHWRLPNGRTGRLGPLRNDQVQDSPRGNGPGRIVYWRVFVLR